MAAIVAQLYTELVCMGFMIVKGYASLIYFGISVLPMLSAHTHCRKKPFVENASDVLHLHSELDSVGVCGEQRDLCCNLKRAFPAEVLECRIDLFTSLSTTSRCWFNSVDVHGETWKPI